MRILALLSLLFAASPALADNHFILELEAGFARPLGIEAESDIGSAYAGTFGFGGRIPGFAPAYYLVGRVAHSAYTLHGPARSGSAEVIHGESEVALGGRMYLPILPRLRGVFQMAIGETYGATEVTREGRRDLLADSENFTLFGMVGLQLRVSNHLSMGANVDVAYMPDREEFSVVKTAAGLQDDGVGRLRMGATMTFHF